MMFPFFVNNTDEESKKSKTERRIERHKRSKISLTELQKEFAWKLLRQSGPCSCGKNNFVLNDVVLDIRNHYYAGEYYFPAVSFTCNNCKQMRFFNHSNFNAHNKE